MIPVGLAQINLGGRANYLLTVVILQLPHAQVRLRLFVDFRPM